MGVTAGLREAKALEKLRLSRVSDDVKRCSYDDRRLLDKLTNGLGLKRFASNVTSNSHATHIRKLQLLQKKAIRIITSSHYIEHTDPLFAMTKLLKLEDLYKYQLGIFMHKVTHSQLPQNMSSMFLRTDKIHSHKLRNQNAYYTVHPTNKNKHQEINN